MLTQLSIRNFAIVERLDLDLNAGMTVISGETGAGKSIMLDALGLTLGDRADSDTVRVGAERAEIAASYDITLIPEALNWLKEHDLEQDSECLVRRIITSEGRSRSYINGQPTPLAMLKELGQLLVDIHGQHEHQRLLKKDHHRVLLDAYANHTSLADEVKRHFSRWHHLQNELKVATEQSSEKNARIQLLSYQLEELEQLGLTESELSALEEEQQRLENAGDILRSGHQLLALTSDSEDENAIAILNHCLQLLDNMQSQSPRLQQANELLNSALIQIDEAGHEIRHYVDSVEINPERLQEVTERLTSIYDVARKHRVLPEQLPALHQQLQDEMNTISRSDEAIAELKTEVDQALTSYLKLAESLSKKRQQFSEKLSKAVDSQLHNLGMLAAHFTVQLTPNAQNTYSAAGLEEVEFLISTNKGQKAKPLAKVASGGELSRISLAIQVVTAETSDTPTLVFDEVDVGIGGAIAEVVGRMLRKLGDRTQVLCVTHQPQVASQGHQHLFVSKTSQKNQTQTRIDVLNDDRRVHEVARMLGGIELTDTSFEHAREMLRVH